MLSSKLPEMGAHASSADAISVSDKYQKHIVHDLKN
jgi:hypothetical protein